MTNLGGAMCGRCMKTARGTRRVVMEKPFRWAAMHVLAANGCQADDKLNANDQSHKKWWWMSPRTNRSDRRGKANQRPRTEYHIQLRPGPDLAMYPIELHLHLPMPIR